MSVYMKSNNLRNYLTDHYEYLYVHVSLSYTEGGTSQRHLVDLDLIRQGPAIRDTTKTVISRCMFVFCEGVHSMITRAKPRAETAVVFHVAASINLDASLKDALDINAKGTLNVLNLCQKMAQLQALVHVSSAYSNCNRDFIAEKIYPTLAPLDAVYHLLENGLDSPLTRNVVDKRPNNYTYSKAVAEELVAHERGRVPAAIVRPTIIISSKSEPAKGWVDNWGGANGPIVGMGKGLVRTWPAAPDTMIDFVPVDMVANLLIAVAWDTHVRNCRGDKEVKVYNCSCGVKNPLTSRNFLRTCLHYTRKHQFRNVRWYPTLFMTDKKLLMWTVTYLLEILPAVVIDAVGWLFRREPRMIEKQKKLLKLRSVQEYFTLHQFTFLDYNVAGLRKTMSLEDRSIFDFNMNNIDWDSFIETYVIGLRKYLLKEDPGDELQ
ncbi:Putative fatty acyl-CoA reductase CG5065 [Eumeta japonica]|uniref:Fatty acyl-CoA reductase n=1 Tax=Eumeta variegata TaxID=151549 RepID=A0A4C1XBA5_EUMVA|nr:Putative fatty acyl-CoA reductase CG5065 [Eumeta japonica]